MERLLPLRAFTKNYLKKRVDEKLQTQQNTPLSTPRFKKYIFFFKREIYSKKGRVVRTKIYKI